MHNQNKTDSFTAEANTSATSFSSYGKLLEIQYRNVKARAFNLPRQPIPESSKSPARDSKFTCDQRLSATMGKFVTPNTERNTSAFTSVSREKRGNFRFPIRLCKNQIKYHPNYFYGNQSSPKWSLSKAQRTPKKPFVDYEICEKSPLNKHMSSHNHSSSNLETGTSRDDSKQKLTPTHFKLRRSVSNNYSDAKKRDDWARSTMAASTVLDFSGNMSPAKTTYNNNNISIMLNKSNAFSVLSGENTAKKRYSIVEEKQTSNVGRFHKTKVKFGRKVNKQEIMKAQEEQRNQHEKTPLIGENLFIDFDRQKPRKPNVKFLIYMIKIVQLVHEECLTEDRFKNAAMYNDYDVSKNIHSFDKYLARQSIKPDNSPIYDILGKTNLQKYYFSIAAINMNKVKEDTKRGNVKFRNFRDKVKVRQDRAQPEPHLRLSYDYSLTTQGHLSEPKGPNYDKMTGRNPELFPIIDYAIKRESDALITEDLRSHINKPDFMAFVL